MKLNELITTLQQIKGTNAKIDLLRQHEKDPLVVAYLNATYEPRINYFVRPDFLKKADINPLMGTAEFDQATIRSLRDQLASRALTGNTARNWLTNIYQHLAADQRPLLYMLLAGDIRAGVSGTAINKVWPNLLTYTPYMRCGLPRDTDLKKWFEEDGDAIAQIKADGTFTNFDVTDDNFMVYSRAGKVYPVAPFQAIYGQIKSEIDQPCIIHGEMLVFEDGKLMPRAEGNGVLNSIAQGDTLAPNQTIEFHVWDVIPKAAAVKKGTVKVPYEQRLKELTAIVGNSGGPVKIIETVRVKSLEAAKVYYRQQLAKKQEGIILKRKSGLWEDGTSCDQIKFKKEAEVELRVIGFRPGRGKHEGTFGSLICRTEDMLCEVGVSGISDKLRAEINADREGWLQAIITVRVNDLMSPSEETEGLYSLYLPRFIERRFDKDTANTLAEVIAIIEAA